jgi:hypothetical protein
MDRWLDMMKLIGAFCGFGNVPKKEYGRKEGSI